MSFIYTEEGLNIFVFGVIGWAAAFVGGIYFHRFPLAGSNKGRERMIIGGFMAVILVLVAMMFGIDTKDFK